MEKVIILKLGHWSKTRTYRVSERSQVRKRSYKKPKCRFRRQKKIRGCRMAARTSWNREKNQFTENVNFKGEKVGRRGLKHGKLCVSKGGLQGVKLKNRGV